MNNVILVGRLTSDPELRQTQSGIASARFTVAVNRRFKNQQTGEYDADFITCVAWKQTAEFISRYFTKGARIVLEGSLRSGSYTDRKHSDVTHYTTEVYVDNVEFAGSKSDNARQGNNTSQSADSGYTAVQAANNAGINTEPMEYESNNDFEEILSDGDVPF